MDRDHLLAHDDLLSACLEPVAHALPELPGPEAGIPELVDQRFDDRTAFLVTALALEAGQGALDRLAEVEALDALSCPVGGEFLSADAPDLLCVSLEEDREEAIAELVAHPIFQGL